MSFDTDCYEPEVIKGQVETLGLLLGKKILKHGIKLMWLRKMLLQSDAAIEAPCDWAELWLVGP